MADLKLCRDCKNYYYPLSAGYKDAPMCNRGRYERTNLVTGDVVVLECETCNGERIDPHPAACGIEAKFWEAK